ncbi:MAG: tRNA lysidine(34) synthetase TilS [Flavobacteriaceae bacterium]|nr:tRNA lysidine(34) synthetase TilS [Flavobacteriaceae bacterium]
MLVNFQQHINQHFPFLKDKKLLIAISGGIDSVVLTHLLHQSKFNIPLAHCNFKLRDKESDLDEEFVKEFAKKLDLKLHTISFPTDEYAAKNKLSIQMAARELRYDWFVKILEENNLDYVLTAHQKDDVLETFLINFTRGTGLEGLTGIPAINGNIVRPLLVFTRDEIHSFATENNIDWREDKSNTSTKYFRNKIRHQVIPVLKELNPSLMQTFDKTLKNLQGSQQIINDSIENIQRKTLTFDGDIQQLNISEIKKLSNPKAYLFELLKEYHFTEWNDITDLLNAQSGKQVLSKTYRLVKNRDFLLLSERMKDEGLKGEFKINKDDGFLKNDSLNLKIETQNLKLKTQNNNPKVALIDKDLLKFPLIVRKWQKGDYFYPFGMQGKKKLSKFFKDGKLSIIDKENIWLLCNTDNDIIWIVGKRLDNRFKIVKNTTKTLKITLQ